jgi:sugar O-acyltransferase (sialic acid O-acetyltransferase NeuD family)
MPFKQPLYIVILGAGGDALVVAEAIRQAAEAGQSLKLTGFLDDNLVGQTVDELPVMGRLDEWSELSADVCFVLALHKVRQMHKRAALVAALNIPEARWARIIHPSAVVARSARIASGAFLAANVVVQPNACIGHNVSIRAGASIGHDAICGDYAYVGPNATLCGKARLGEGAHLGPNSVIVDGVTVEPYAVVGAGTVATKRVPSFEVHFGVPARKVLDIKP